MPTPPDAAHIADTQDVPSAADPRIGFVLRLGRALHAYGYPADRLEDVLDEIARGLGLESQIFSTPTSIFAAFGPQDRQHTHLIRVDPGDVQIEKLAAVDHVAREVRDGLIAPSEGAMRIDRIAAAPERYGPAIVTLAFGLSSAAAARFLGGGAREIVHAAALGLVVGILSVSVRGRELRRVFEPTAAFVASALAAVLSRFAGPSSVYIATLAAILILLPGLTLTSAMTEIATRHLASGTTRLSGAVMTFLTIAFGVAMGNQAAAALLGTLPPSAPIPLAAWTEWAVLLIAPVSLTVLLRGAPRDLPVTITVGALSFVGGRIGARVLGPELGIFAGALTAGLASNFVARRRDVPSVTTLVPAVLLIVPGSVGFRSLASLLERHVVVGVETAFRMVLMLSALVAGLLVANVILPERRPRSVDPRIQ